MDTSKMITGQIIFRDAGEGILGRKKMMFVGIIDVPDNFELLGENQYVVFSNSQDDMAINLNIIKDGKINRTKEFRGCDLGGLVQKPIWRT